MARPDDVWTNYDLDGTDERVVTRRKDWRPTTDKLLLYCNGWSRRGRHILGGHVDDDASRILAATCAREGMTVVAHDFTTNAGADGWGNSEVIAKVAAQKSWGQSATAGNGQSAAGKIVLIGVSMGAVAALNYALSLATPSNTIAGIALLNPVLDLDDIAEDPGTDPLVLATLYAAYGGTAETFAALSPAWNPNARRQAIGDMQVPIRIWASPDDTRADFTTTIDFANKVRGVSLVETVPQGHLIDDHPMEEIAAWLRDRA